MLKAGWLDSLAEVDLARTETITQHVINVGNDHERIRVDVLHDIREQGHLAAVDNAEKNLGLFFLVTAQGFEKGNAAVKFGVNVLFDLIDLRRNHVHAFDVGKSF